MNGSRNRYTSAPLHSLKNKKMPQQQNTQPQAQPQADFAQPQQPLQQNTQQPYNQQNSHFAPQQQGYAPYQQQNPYGYQQNAYQQKDPYGYQQNVWQQPYAAAHAQNMQPAPRPAQQSKGEKPFMWLVGVVTLLLPLLFIAALIIGNVVVHGVFIAGALGVILTLLIARPFNKNARYTLAFIYAALIAVMAVALFFALPAQSRTQPASAGLDPQALFGGSSALESVSGVQYNQPEKPNEPLAGSVPQPEGTAVPVVSAAQMRLNTFMNFWAESQLDSMLDLALPSWVSNQENPKSELFILLANRTPISYTVETISGSDADTSRTVTLTVLIDKKNTSDPAYYQMQVLMLRINDTWYVDPNSLGATKMSTTPQPGDQEAGTIPFVPTQAPTEAPTMSANTVLYYNPDGGSYYHGSENCSRVAAEYLPLTPFYYSDLNSTKYKNLLACNKCDAPARPVITGY